MHRQKIKLIVKYPKVSKTKRPPKSPTESKHKWKDSKLFWVVLASVSGLSLLYGIINCFGTGAGAGEILALAVLACLTVLFSRTAAKKPLTVPPLQNPVITQVETSKTPSLSDVDNMDGIQFEQWCAGLLRQIGYSDVETTKSSGDQGVDILAKKEGIKYAIQCKCYSSPLGNKPVQEVNAGKIIYHCQIGVVMTNQHFTPGAKEAAEATGVLLWGREELARLVQVSQIGEAQSCQTP